MEIEVIEPRNMVAGHKLRQAFVIIVVKTKQYTISNKSSSIFRRVISEIKT
ncbi:unnamed protein product, partial [Larinioides sclopetarius]